MNPVQNPVEAAHRDLQNVLLNGRILINGLPLTGNELGAIIQGEQMLYGKATQSDKEHSGSEETKKEGKIIPLKQPEKK